MKISDIENTLSIPREQLPQIDFKYYDNIINDLKPRFGTVPANQLKPIQDQLNMDKIKSMIDDNVFKEDRQLFISKEGFIVDGHHYWAANCEVEPTKRLKVILVDMNIIDLVNWFNSTDYVEHKTIKESKQ